MRIGIDLGGTKIEGIVMDRDGTIAARVRRPTPVAQGYETILDAVCQSVAELERPLGQTCRVGIGTPGSISSRTRTLKNSNTVCMNGKPVKDHLEQCLERELRIENDANCFTLSEAIDGAAQDHRMVFGIIMGTGVGGGIVFDGTLHAGPQHIAGEWGHNILEPNGWDCYCGRKGCVETYLSGPGLVRAWHTVATEHLSAEQIVARALNGDPRAEQVMSRFLEYFGRALAMVVNILDPDAIVLGGGLSNIQRLYTEGPGQLAKWVFNDELRTIILPNQHGDSSGVRGAAQLWPP